MQRPLRLLVPIGRATTTWARLPDVVATVGDDLGLWQVCGGCDPGAGVGAVLTWTEHRVALLAPRVGSALYAKRLLGATRCSRYSLFLHRLHGKIPRALYDDGPVTADPGDDGRPVFVVVAPAGLALLAATPWPTPQRLLPALFGLTLVASGMIQVVGFDRPLQLPLHFVGQGRVAQPPTPAIARLYMHPQLSVNAARGTRQA